MDRSDKEKTYIGTKIIAAEPMNEWTFISVIKKQDVPKTENREGYKVRYEDGYISWSPKETFERAYRLVTPEEKELLTKKGGNL